MEPDFSQELVGEVADVRGSVVQKQHGGKWYAALPQESQRRTVLHPLEQAALLAAERRDGASSYALVALLGMLGLRVGGRLRR